MDKKVKFKYKLTLIEYIARYIIYSISMAILLLLLYSYANSIYSKIIFWLILIASIAMHFNSMKRLAESMKNEKMTFNIGTK